MAETSEVHALEKISTEVDESQMKVILSTQCIKAQAFLVNKLRKQSERSKETCNFISSANMKLQAEITQAQQEIRSLLIAQETIKMANVELKKEWLMAKDRKLEVIERAKNGEKKYEDLWRESKARYESLSFVQKLLKAKDEVQNLEQQMINIDYYEKTLIKEIEVKKETCLNLDRKRIIELADFIVNEMPKTINLLMEKSAAVRDLTNELENLDLKAKADVDAEEPKQHKAAKDVLKTDNNRSLAEKNNSSLIMPKLELSYLDFEVLSVDQVKKNTVDYTNKTPAKKLINSMSDMKIDASKKINIENTEEYISSFFNKPSVIYEEYKTQNYAKKKLINILEDIKIDKNEAQTMLANVNPETLQPVDSISVDDKNTNGTCGVIKNKDKQPLESEEIEEIDLTGSNEENLLIPPTQFLDIVTLDVQEYQKEQQEVREEPASTSKQMVTVSQNQSSQERLTKKRVAFDLPNTLLESNVVNDAEKPDMTDEIDVNETLNSQLDVSAVSDDAFAKMKDIIMKQHNLDLSPQFVYAKNVMTPLNLQKSEDGGLVTSKFFQHNQIISKVEPDVVEKATIDDDQEMEVNEIAANPKKSENKPTNQSQNDKNTNVEIDTDTDMVSSPKRRKIEMLQSDKPVSGFLFSHTAQIIPDSLDVSISTTGFEDGDADFPHCIDSSLLLSPKADIPMPMTGENTEVLSQDVPNFLSGLRKTGLSFFGCLPSESKPNSSTQHQGESGFSFNFGGDEKKSRGGLFSMFK